MMNTKIIVFLLVTAAVSVSAACRTTECDKTAMPLSGVRIVAADEFWTAPQMKWPRSLPSTKVHWGLSAARDLTNALYRVIGREVPLIRESEASAGGVATIYLGPTKAAAVAGLDPKSMMAGEWRIKCDGKRAFILSRTGMGAAYGVTDFLEKFAGYRFLTMDGEDPYVPNPSAAVPECDFTAKHYFYARHFGARTKYTPDTNAKWMNPYFRRLGLYISPEVEGFARWSPRTVRYCHTFLNYFPPEEYFKVHPEYFSMDDNGRRVKGPNTMLCLSNPDVRRIVREKVLKFIAEDRVATPEDPPLIYDFSQTDGVYYICRCPECRKIAAKHGGDAKREFGCVSEGDSGLLLDFVNELARAVGAKYPDVYIRTFAYVNTARLPKGILPEKNVIPWFCDWYMKSDHQLPLEHPFNSWSRKELEKWCAVSRNVELWDYMLFKDEFPELSVDAIAADLRLFKRLGIGRFYIENHYYGQPFFELNAYVYSKFFRDPDGSDLEKAIDEYCIVYGAGAAKMREAIDFLRKIIAENPPESFDLWHSRSLPWRTVDNMENFRDLVREAFTVEMRPKPRARIALALESADKELARLYKITPGAAAKREETKAEWRTAARAVFDGAIFAGGDRASMFKRSEDELAYADFKIKRLPDVLKDVPEDEMIGLDIRACPWIGPANKQVVDPDSECEKAVRAQPKESPNPLDWALIRSPETKQCDKLSVKPVKGDGYRWYCLGVARLGRGGNCYLSNSMSFDIGRYYVECDGMAEDPNWYEFWLSVKYNGDYYSVNEKEGVFIDRLLLRRVKKP